MSAPRFKRGKRNRSIPATTQFTFKLSGEVEKPRKHTHKRPDAQTGGEAWRCYPIPLYAVYGTDPICATRPSVGGW